MFLKRVCWHSPGHKLRICSWHPNASKIYMCKFLQPSHPYREGLKWVEIGSLNIISGSLGARNWSYTVITSTCCHSVLWVRLGSFRHNYCSYRTKFETSHAFSCSFNFRYPKEHAKKCFFRDVAVSCTCTVKTGLDCHVVFQLLARIRYLSAPLVHNQKRYYLEVKKKNLSNTFSFCLWLQNQAREHFKLQAWKFSSSRISCQVFFHND